VLAAPLGAPERHEDHRPVLAPDPVPGLRISFRQLT
jgi:hypothetical protein